MRVALILPLLFILSACGFHLAGSKPLSDDLKKVYLDTTIPYSVTEPPIEAQLRAILQRRGAEVAKDPSAEVTPIRLSNLRESREVLSLGPDGKAVEFRLLTRGQIGMASCGGRVGTVG